MSGESSVFQRLFVVLLGFFLATASARASDDPPTTVLFWSAPEGCPQELQVRAVVERYLGQSLAIERDQRLRIQGEVRRERSEFAVVLRITSEQGAQSRELSNVDCHDLTAAAALVAALAIDPTLKLSEVGGMNDSAGDTPPAEPALDAASLPAAETSPPTPVVAPAPPVTTPSARTIEERSFAKDVRAPGRLERQASGVTLSGMIVGLAGGGPLPGVGLGAGVRMLGARGHWGAAARGAYLLPRTEPVPGHPDAGVELDLWLGGLSACWLPLEHDLAVVVCLGPAMGSLRGSGKNLVGERTRRDRWTALGGDILLNRAIGAGISVLLGVEASAVVEAPRFGIRENGHEVEVFHARPWAAFAFLGLGLSPW